ncbi:MAG: hypothetical protein LBR79_06890 [Oscillospiraceae bacterium]|nr:hypothetical protein [Oscillospiraceae bacterium]
MKSLLSPRLWRGEDIIPVRKFYRLQLKSGSCPKIVEIFSFSPRLWRGGKILSINLDHYQIDDGI